MKKCVYTVVFTCIVGSLSGCADVPSEVEREISILDNLEQEVSEPEFSCEYEPLSEIRNSIDSVIADNHRIVQVIGTPSLPTGTNLHSYQLYPIVMSKEDTSTAFQNVVDILDYPQLTTLANSAAWYDTTTPITELEYVSEDGTILKTDFADYGWKAYADGMNLAFSDGEGSLNVASHGAASNYWLDTEPPIYYTALDIENVIPVGYDESGLENSYAMLNGEEWKIADAVAFAENFYNTAFSTLPQKLEYRVKEVIVRRLPDGGFGYDFSLQQVLPSGEPILCLSLLNYSETESFDSLSSGRVCTLWCVMPDTVQEYSMPGCVELKGAFEQPLLSAESALQIVSDTIAQQQTIYVHMELGLLYQINDSEYINYTRNSGDFDFALQNHDYTDAQAIPYWLFWQEREGVKSRISGTYYLVNALTGELEIR